MRLVSVNVSEPREVEYRGQSVRTGIFKEPMTGRVKVNTLNIAGDGQADRTFRPGAAHPVRLPAFLCPR